MTNTTITAAANLGGNTSLANQSITQTELQIGTTTVILNVSITTGPEAVNQSDEVEVWYVVYPSSLTADSTLPAAIMHAANYARFKPAQSGNTTRRYTIPAILNNGGYLYTWFNSPALSPSTNIPGTITIQSVELP